MLKKLKLNKVLRKQHYGLVGKHSGVQICRWAKKDLIDDGECYKAKFYGIKSHQCCQMSPSVGFCQNRCLHCWRAIELTIGDKMNLTKVDNPKEIISGCIAEQKRLINGFKGNKKINLEKFKQAQEPMQFAISLTGEPTIYPRLGELIQELRKQGKTSFVVTNGLLPERLKQLQKQKALPTQLYLSLNAPNEKLFNKWHKSKEKQAWKKFNQTLELFPKLLTRKVIRMTLVKDLNMLDNQIKDYTKLIKKANPDFIEVKGYMSVGFARQRLGYETMPTYEDIQDYAKKISKALGKPYKILNSHEFSRVILIGKNKKMMKIQKNKI
jgi:tRNA wybutosine-synthesizing protein 1